MRRWQRVAVRLASFRVSGSMLALGGVAVGSATCTVSNRSSLQCNSAVQPKENRKAEVLSSPAISMLMSIIRDQRTCQADYVRASDRLMAILAEEGIARLPSVKPSVIQTPCGPFHGVTAPEGHNICAVDIVRSGGILLEAVRKVIPELKTAKILIRRDEATALPQLYYSKLPDGIEKSLLLCCWKTYLTWAIIPLLLAISLIVNRFPSARSYMTRGGQNAALTEEGFKHTAAWRDSGEVLKYVTRVLKEDMKAKLTDPRQLKTFASQAVRDGQPTLTLEQLRLALSAADFVEMEEQYFRKGDLVWVNGRFPAKVESTAGDPSAGTDRVLVTYEKSLVMEDLPPEEVRGRQVTLRADGLPNLDPLRKVPGGAGILDSAIEAIYPIIEDVRHLSLPGIHQLTEIFTWKKSTVTTVMVVVLLIISSLFGYAAWLHRTSGQNGNLSRKEEILISVLRSLDNWVAALIIVGIFFLQGWFMANVSSVIKIASRSTKGRPAPATWAFFTPDSVQADLLRSLAAKEADMHPHGGFHLPYMTGDGSSASASYAAAHAIGP